MSLIQSSKLTDPQDDGVVFTDRGLLMFSRSYFSISHLQSAYYFATRARDIETQYSAHPLAPGSFRDEHRSYVVSSVILSCAFLEAMINEIFSDCHDDDTHCPVTDKTAASLMKWLWSRDIPRTAKYSILDKYEIALEAANSQPFDRGASPHQDVKLITQLRNTFIHFEPETVLTAASTRKGDELHKLEKKLDKKFPLNPLTGTGNAFYPDKLLGFGCAKWAFNSVVAFSDQFCERMNIKPIYNHVRPIIPL